MGKAKNLTEPSLIPCLFITGSLIEVAPSTVRIVQWVELPRVAGHEKEWRIQSRTAMTPETARRLYKDLGRGLKALRKGGLK